MTPSVSTFLAGHNRLIDEGGASAADRPAVLAEALLETQKDSLEMVVKGAPLHEVLAYLTTIVEALAEGRAIASILLLDAGGRLRHGAAPSLPDEYNNAVDGIEADANVGTCAAAAATGRTVITSDFESDPAWRDLKHLPLALGLRSAWSMPIFSRDGRVLGTFGTYFRTSRTPTENEVKVVEVLSRTAALAIEREADEQELRHAHALIENITQSTDDLIAAEDSEFRFLYFNEAYKREFQRLWGAELKVGMSMLDAMAAWPEEQAKARDMWSRSLAGESFRVTAEFGPSPDKMQVYDLHFDPLVDRDGSLVGAAHILRNVTDRVRTQQQLLESEERFRQVTESLPQLVWTCRTDGYCDYLGTQWVQYTGIPEEPQRGSGWMEQVHPDERPAVMQAWQRAASSGEDFKIEFRIRRHDGEYRWFRTLAVPLRDALGHITRWFGSNTDIHDLKEAEAELRASRERISRHAEELERALEQRSHEVRLAERRIATSERMAAVGTFAAGLAHDMSNVLFPLGLRLDSLLMHSAVDGATHDHLVAVQGLLTHLREMAKNLSLFARDPEQEGVVGRTSLAEWSERAWRFIEASIRPADRSSPPIALSCTIADGLPEVAVAPHRLTQAVFNIINNARDAIMAKRQAAVHEGREFVGSISMTASGECAPGCVAITIVDDGGGMDEDTARRSIEPFFTTRQRPVAAGAGGSGLGLSLVHSIVERAGGSFSISSQPDQGTTITILLPVASEEASKN